MRRLAVVLLFGCHAVPPRTPARTAAAPCFPELATLAGNDARLEQFAAYPGDDGTMVGAGGTFGTCSVSGGIVRSPDGTTVAEIGCGVDWSVPGVVDDRGLGVGARGDAVLASYGDAAIACQPNWSETPRVRCWVPDDTGEWEGAKWEYIVDGVLPGYGPEDAMPLEGEAARAFFAPRTVVMLEYRGACH